MIAKQTISIHFSFKDFYKAQYCATVEGLFLTLDKQNSQRNKKAKELIGLKKRKFRSIKW